MPVELAIGSGLQSHVYTRHFGGNGEILQVLLTSPSGIVYPQLVVAETERPHGLRNIASVRAGRGVDIRVELLILISPCIMLVDRPGGRYALQEYRRAY
jgi:hypothetical protein